MIYFFTSIIDPNNDRPTKDTWDLYNWFIPLNLKERPVEGVKGLIMRPETGEYYSTSLGWSADLERAPFMTEDMRRKFVEGIFRALT